MLVALTEQPAAEVVQGLRADEHPLPLATLPTGLIEGFVGTIVTHLLHVTEVDRVTERVLGHLLILNTNTIQSGTRIILL